MRLGYTITSYPPAIGGAQLHAHMLARHLAPDFQVQVASMWSEHRTDWLRGTTISAPAETLSYELEGVAVTRIGLALRERIRLIPPVAGFFLMQRRAVGSIARALLPHLLPVLEGAQLVHNFRIGREPLSYASLMAARELRVPFVLTPFHHPRWGSWLHRVYHHLYRQADGVFALTEAEREVLIGLGVSAERIAVVGHGPVLADDPRPERFRARVGAQEPFVLFLGQKYAYKGLSALLEAAPRVWARCPDVRFVFIGPRTRASQRLFNGERDPRIIEMDTVSLKEKTDALAACEILCVPSAQESFGGVYAEAWALGKPVIAADTPATRELVQHGSDGLLVTQDSAAIADAVLTLVQDRAMAKRLGASGQEKVREHFQWSTAAEKAASAYAKVLNRSGVRASC